MAQITRSTKIGGGTVLQANTLARAADVETDVLALFNAHNNHDAGTSKWQVGSFENASSTVVIANNSTGTNNIFEARDNGTAVHTIADGGNQTFTGKMLGPDGTAALPTYSFSSAGSADNGLYLAGADNPAISAGGTKRLDITTSTITAALPLAMGSNKITGLAAATAAGNAVRFEQLKVIQVVSVTSTTAFTTTSNTFVETNLATTITPTSSSNKVLILVTGSVRNGNAAADTCFVTLARATTNIGGTNGFQEFTGTTGDLISPCAITYLDSPATTSVTQYDVRIRNTAGAVTVGFGRGNQVQSLVLIEVAP